MTNYDDNVEFLAVSKVGYKRDDKGFEHLCKGRYDIDFAINLCDQIIDKCETNILNPGEVRFSLMQSLKQLVRFLRTEKLPKSDIVGMHCKKCDTSELIHQYEEKNWQCAKCKPKGIGNKIYKQIEH